MASAGNKIGDLQSPNLALARADLRSDRNKIDDVTSPYPAQSAPIAHKTHKADLMSPP